MAKFEMAIEPTLAHEGGYVFDPDDPGGETKYGISKRTYPGEDIKNLTRERAKQIYGRDFWIPLYEQIEDQSLANKLFDFGVNAGKTTAIRMLQRAIGAITAGPLVVDGVFGPRTLWAANACGPELLQEFRAQIAVHYAEVAIRRPASAKFLLGWMRRAMA